MIDFAPAKINLGLFITEKRTDGFHNLESIFWPIGWHDVIDLSPAPEMEGMELNVHGISIPGDASENIMVRAHALVQRHFVIPGVRADLLKNIPLGSGLGGGSSDGTRTLMMLNDLFELKMLPEQLYSMALELGSDCPFFLQDRPAIVSGRGENIVPILTDTSLSGWHITVMHPGVHISTAEAFQSIVPHALHTNLELMLASPVSTWKRQFRNDFESTARSQYPAIESACIVLDKHGAAYVQMTGTGAAVFGIFKEASDAITAAQSGAKYGWKCHHSRL